MKQNARDSAVPIAIALICILGIGVAAATLTTAEAIGAPEGSQLIDPPDPQGMTGPGDPQQPGDGAQGEGEANQGGGQGGVQLTTCIEPLASPLGILAYVAAFVGIVGLSYRRFNFPVMVLVGWTLLPPAMLAYFLTTDCGVGGSTASMTGGASLGRAGEQIVPVSQVPPWLMAVVVGGLIVAAGVILYRSTGPEETVVTEEQAADEPELDEFAAAAGRAADRIEDHNADVDNAVYEAWVEMIGLLDVERPETYSPGEFAEAAVDVGMAEDDVAELTRLFNEVRYGGKDAGTREDRSISVLRSIEAQYATSTDSASVDGRGSDAQTTTDDEQTDTTGDGSETDRARDDSDDLEGVDG